MQRVAISRILSGATRRPRTVRSFLSPRRNGALRKAECDYYPETVHRSGRARRPAFPVLSCTTWGFSCPAGCPTGGGLLPRLFTLTLSPKTFGRFVFCDTFRGPVLSPAPPACSTRHVVWRCSDFPLAARPPEGARCQRPSATRCTRTLYAPAAPRQEGA